MNRRLIRSYILLVAVAILLFTVPVAFTLTNQLRDDTELSVGPATPRSSSCA